MKYYQEITLKNGKKCILRNGSEEDAKGLLENMILTHNETDFLLSYPDEIVFDEEKEKRFLKEKTESENEIEIVAIVDGAIVGSAGIDAIGSKYKIRHRAECGISVAKEFWRLGIGKDLMKACIECAKEAGLSQLELDVVADNEKAILLYEKLGFIEFGRNPKGFLSRENGYQEIINMRLELQ